MHSYALIAIVDETGERVELLDIKYAWNEKVAVAQGVSMLSVETRKTIRAGSYEARAVKVIDA